MGRYSEKGITPEIPGKPSYNDHVTQEIETEFCITKEIPIPPEIADSSEWVSTTPHVEILSFGKTQFPALQQLVLGATQSQTAWNNLTPHVIRPAADRFQAVAFRQLLSHFN